MTRYFGKTDGRVATPRKVVRLHGVLPAGRDQKLSSVGKGHLREVGPRAILQTCGGKEKMRPRWTEHCGERGKAWSVEERFPLLRKALEAVVREHNLSWVLTQIAGARSLLEERKTIRGETQIGEIDLRMEAPIDPKTGICGRPTQVREKKTRAGRGRKKIQGKSGDRPEK